MHQVIDWVVRYMNRLMGELRYWAMAVEQLNRPIKNVIEAS